MGMRGWLISTSVAALALGCTSSKSSDGATNSAPVETVDAAAPSLCTTDMRGQKYAPSMTQTGKAGVFKLKLLNIIPAPAAVGHNTWELELDDAQGNGVGDATITLAATMPDHANAVPAPATISADPLPGQYSAMNLTLPIPGLWVFTFSISTPADAGAASDTVVFTFCVAD